ncbi:MAG: hypothetical protein AAF610_00465 [Pseudomonadota bacterium]
MENENIYKPPEAELGTTTKTETETNRKYYVVSKRKYYALSILTFGLYYVFWFYKNYSLIRARTGESLWPAARGLFSVFFAHNLCNRVNADLEESQYSFNWNPAYTATLYVLVSILANVVSRIESGGDDLGLTDVIVFVLIPVLAVGFFPAQKAINIVSGDSHGLSNNNFSGLNLFFIVVFSLAWALVLLGMLLLVTLPADSAFIV